MLIGVVGDCTLDASVSPTGPISPSPGHPSSAYPSPGHDVRAQIGLAPGGQAANVAVRLARRGVRVRLVSPIADDVAGTLLAAQVAAESVELCRLPAERTAMVVALLGPGGERSMLSDRIALDGDIAGALRGADWVHCSGYALRDRPEAGRVVAGLRASGVGRVSVGGGSFEDATDAAAAREAIGVLRADLVVMDREEAAFLAGKPARGAAEAAARLATDDRLVVVTDGARGAAVAGLALPAPLTASPPGGGVALDATGAGDAFTAVVLSILADSWPPSPELIRTALDAAVQAGQEATQVAGAQGRLPGEGAVQAGGGEAPP